MLQAELAYVTLVQKQGIGLFFSRDRGRIIAIIKNRHLSHGRAGAFDVNNLFAAVTALAESAHRHGPARRSRRVSAEQGRLEGARDCVAALARLGGVADHDDPLAGLREPAQLIAQAFLKIPALHALAPKGNEPPFAIAQGILLVLFIIAGVMAVKKFHPDAALSVARAA